jgi:hypothetical protein
LVLPLTGTLILAEKSTLTGQDPSWARGEAFGAEAVTLGFDAVAAWAGPATRPAASAARAADEALNATALRANPTDIM